MTFPSSVRRGLIALFAVMALAIPAQGAIKPESDVLLPWFEVNLERGDQGLATNFSVVNATPHTVNAVATVYTNWGIPALDVTLTFKPAEAKTLLLHEWILHGELPDDRALTPEQLAVLQAMLTGTKSPIDGLYYSTPFRSPSPHVAAEQVLAVGYVIVRTLDERPDAFWGDTHSVDLVQNYLEAETLAVLTHDLKAECNHHGIRFDNQGLLFESDELVVWSGRRFAPSPTGKPIGTPMKMYVDVYDQAGNLVHTCYKELLAVETAMLCDDVDIPIGWLDIRTEDPTFILDHLHSLTNASAELHSYCLTQDLKIGPSIDLDKMIDNQAADRAPGPRYEIGSPMEFEFVVTNTGSETLTNVTVVDDPELEITCPKTTLQPGESMICTAQSTAVGCLNADLATATGTAPNNIQVSASDTAYYHADYSPAITLELLVNGDEADDPKGPQVEVDSQLQWSFVVTNTGDAPLDGIVVELRKGEAATCPKSELAPGESMTCSLESLARAGQHHEIGVVTASDPCDTVVSASDPAWYFAPPTTPGIEFEKYIGESDADTPPGPSIPAGTPILWRFLVTNVGNVPLTDIVMTDDSLGVTPTCPKTTLDVGESMFCTASSYSLPCQQTNTATVTAKAGDEVLQKSDPANYFGTGQPALTLELSVNGDAADTPLGPHILEGQPLSFTWLVTNTGQVEVTDISASDDLDQVAVCPQTSLQPGQSMTCTTSGTALAGGQQIVGTVYGKGPCEETVDTSDPAFYFGDPLGPGITVVKLTNGTDVSAAPGPELRIGSTVTWTYLVTNIGNVPLTGIAVTDDQGVTPDCPKTALDPGESMTCTATGIAQPCQYANMATAEGYAGQQKVSDTDPSWYFGKTNAAISIDKKTNGEDASEPTGPLVTVGETVTWTFVVTNTGDVALSSVAVTDDRTSGVQCPKSALEPGESMTCTASGPALPGQQTNIATVSGKGPCDETASDKDQSHYFGVEPGINLRKLIEGEDADDPEHALVLTAGIEALWSFVVTNTGTTPLTNVTVSDPTISPITCPKTELAIGESMTCTATALILTGQHCNTATASGTSPQQKTVEDSDSACYTAEEIAAISIVKSTNGEDANLPTGPHIPVGGSVLWTYVVTNTGQVTLAEVTVTDDKGVTVTCPKTTLQPGESMTCTASGIATAGQYANTGSVTGRTPSGASVTDSDPSHYYGEPVGEQGCTPGYWKNHTDSWPPAGYSPSQAVDTVFANVNPSYPALGNATLVDALSFGGGPGSEGAAEILLRAAVAALMNAAHPGVGYPRTPGSVIADVNNALLQSRDAMLALAAALDADNNLGCPLN